MKILATADWHLILNKKNVPKDWSLNRYQSLFSQIGDISNEVDLHIIMGDLFDRTPSLEELALYFQFISNCSIKTIIYPGNHEATRKGHTFLTALKIVTNRINPLVTIVDEVTEYKWGTILPYCSLHKKGIFKNINKDKPLFTHVRGEIPPHVKPEIDLALLKDFPIVYSGDLHAHSNSQLNIVYPGSPVTTSFHRNEVSTGYLIIENDGWHWNTFNLPQLIRKTISDKKDMIATDYNHTIYEIEGDLAELSNIENSDLLDKKIIKRSTEASLILDDSMTITEELYEYFMYVLELPEGRTIELIGTFNDNESFS